MLVRRLLEPLASLRLTVALLALSMVLIFVGTLAQTRVGVWEAVDSYFRGFVAWVDLSLFVPEAAGAIPMPGGATLGVLLLINLVAAHAVRFRLSWRRVGMILIHGGLIVLLAGEFATAWLAGEGLMAIDEGATSSYYEDARRTELVVIDPSPDHHDRVVTIPAAMLRHAGGGATIEHDALPFGVEVVRWMPNARLLRDDAALPADRGIGLEARAQERPRVRGVDGAQSDAPAAYVRLTRDGEDLGTWLVWAGLVGSQRVEVGGRVYGLALRYARTYLPYRLTLHDFRHDTFTGTTIARNFSSDVRLVDEERGVDRRVRIWMNNPLRYRGATFYQASYKPDGSGTVLQVVRNPGAALPYVACALVSAGLLVHFGLSMTTFLRRRGKRLAKLGTPAARRSAWGSLWPWAVGLLGIVLALGALARPVDHGDFDLDTFGRLPVSAGGRLKPMDTAARHALMVAGGRQSVGGEEGMPAVAYLVGLVAAPESVAHLPVVRVDHPGVLALLELTPEDGGRLGLSAIEPHWGSVVEQAHRAMDIDAKQRDPFQRAVLGLYTAVDTLLAHAQLREPFVVPPLGPEGHWRSFHGVMMHDAPFGAASAPKDMHPTVAYMTAMMTAYSQDDAQGFNGAAAGYEALLRDAGRDAAHGHRGGLQPGPAVRGHGVGVRAGVRAVVRLAADARARGRAGRAAAALGGGAPVGRAAGAHGGHRGAYLPAGPPAGDEPVFIGDLRWVGVGALRAGPGEAVSPRRRGAGGGQRGLRDARGGPQLRRRRRHDADDAGGAGQQLLAGHARGHDHPGLFGDVPGRSAGRAVSASGGMYATLNPRAGAGAGADGVRRGVLRAAAELCGHGAGGHLGRPELGPLLGVGPQGERRGARGAPQRDHPARAMGRDRARAGHHGARRGGQHRHGVELVWNEHAGRWAALVWVYGLGGDAADRVRGRPVRDHVAGPAAAPDVAQPS
jgi:hypothetical protein